MTEIIAAISGTGLLGALAAVVYLAIRVANQSEALADARVAQAATEEHLAEAQFKLAQVQQALEASEHVVDVQSKELSANDSTPINQDLRPDDIGERVRRLFASWAVSDAAAAAHPATGATVPASAAPATSSGVPR